MKKPIRTRTVRRPAEKAFQSKQWRPLILPVIVGLLVAGVGLYFLTASRAGTLTVVAEIESGDRQAPAFGLGNIISASGKGMVAFVNNETYSALKASCKKSSKLVNDDTCVVSDELARKFESANQRAAASSKGATAGATSQKPAVSTNSFYDRVCSKKVKASKAGALKNKDLRSVSGIVASRISSGIYWVHNGSGNSNTLYSIKANGSSVGKLTVGSSNIDWEDIATDGKSLLVADIGDNTATRRSVAIYRITEPKTGAKSTPKGDKITVTYADDKPHDAESMFVDSKTGVIYIIDKSAGASNIWKSPSKPAGSIKMTNIGSIGYGKEEIVAADMAPDGSAIVVRTYNRITVYKHTPGGDVAASLKGKGCTTPKVNEAKGEAIAFTADSKGLIATGEGAGNPITLIK